MADQTTAAAERSAHVTRGQNHTEQTCCVCGAEFRVCSYAARVGPPLMQVCSAACAGKPPFSRGTP